MTTRPARPVGRTSPAAVLMYHAVLRPGGDGDGADPHYAIDTDTFARHLQAVRDAGAVPCSVAALLADPAVPAHGRPAVAFTFDDGHASHADAAACLARVGGRADFFVNPGLVGRRGLLDWGALREMAEAGQSIQSHGWTHAWLDTLSPAQVRESLHRSKAVIEDRLACAVTLFAPPGGKRVPGLEALAASLGYGAVCDSRAGLWRTGEPHDRPAGDAPAMRVPRLAVRASIPVGTVAAWARGSAAAVLREQARERTLAGARRLLGAGRYEAVRTRLLAARGGPGARDAGRGGA